MAGTKQMTKSAEGRVCLDSCGVKRTPLQGTGVWIPRWMLDSLLQFQGMWNPLLVFSDTCSCTHKLHSDTHVYTWLHWKLCIWAHSLRVLSSLWGNRGGWRRRQPVTQSGDKSRGCCCSVRFLFLIWSGTPAPGLVLSISRCLLTSVSLI